MTDRKHKYPRNQWILLYADIHLSDMVKASFFPHRTHSNHIFKFFSKETLIPNQLTVSGKINKKKRKISYPFSKGWKWQSSIALNGTSLRPAFFSLLANPDFIYNHQTNNRMASLLPCQDRQCINYSTRKIVRSAPLRIMKRVHLNKWVNKFVALPWQLAQ